MGETPPVDKAKEKKRKKRLAGYRLDQAAGLDEEDFMLGLESIGGSAYKYVPVLINAMIDDAIKTLKNSDAWARWGLNKYNSEPEYTSNAEHEKAYEKELKERARYMSFLKPLLVSETIHSPVTGSGGGYGGVVKYWAAMCIINGLNVLRDFEEDNITAVTISDALVFATAGWSRRDSYINYFIKRESSQRSKTSGNHPKKSNPISRFILAAAKHLNKTGKATGPSVFYHISSLIRNGSNDDASIDNYLGAAKCKDISLKSGKNDTGEDVIQFFENGEIVRPLTAKAMGEIIYRDKNKASKK